MFSSFLHKDDVHYMDLSLIIQYPPQDILYYYYNSFIKIPLEIYQQTRDLARNSPRGRTPCKLWLDLWESYLNTAEDIQIFEDSEFLTTIGPYYFPATNTRFYFTKDKPEGCLMLTLQDFAVISSLRETPAMLDEINHYVKPKKTSKKSKSREDIIRDIDMCLISLREIEKLDHHQHYLQKLLETRQIVLEQTAVVPDPPDNIPDKPFKPELNGNLISIQGLLSRARKKYHQECLEYNHQMKIYLLRYREYLKACDRYKDMLEKWDKIGQDFIATCQEDLERVQEQLGQVQEMLTIYNTVISKSPVHEAYQNIQTLNTFRQYLDTGRANDLQDCMNLFEEEQHWYEIKASQKRIESTIYFLQGSDEPILLAENFDHLLLDRNKESLESAHA